MLLQERRMCMDACFDPSLLLSRHSCFSTTESTFDPTLPFGGWSWSITKIIFVGGIKLYWDSIVLDGVGWERCLNSIRAVGTALRDSLRKGLHGGELADLDVVGVGVLGTKLIMFPKLLELIE